MRPRLQLVLHPVVLLTLLLLTATHHTASAAPQQQQPRAAAAETSTRVDAADAAGRPVVLQTLFNVALDTIVFTAPNFTLVPAAWTYVNAETPYVLDRNFSIRSQLQPAGTVMDWSFLDEKVVVQPGTTFAFDSMVLVNTRKLDTMYFDWFVNSPGAVLTISNCIMIDPVCNATTPIEDLSSAQSLPQLPQQRRNLISTAPPFCLALPNGTECFKYGVHLRELAVVLASTSRVDRDVAASAASAAKSTAAGHFVIRYTNTTRVCRQYLDAQCLQENGGNRSYCWQRAARALMTGGGEAAAAGGGSGRMPAGAIAGAVVGGVAGLLAVLAGILLLFRRQRQRSRQPGADPSTGSSKARAASLLGGSSREGADGPDTQPHRPDDQDASEGVLMDGSVRGTPPWGPGLAQQPQPQPSGRLSSVSNPHASFGRDGLHLGQLIGAGSYGRVCKGRWHGQDVAIKIIHCLPEELQRVLREAEIMLQLDHPNVVRALNCIVQQNPAGRTADAQHGGSRPARPSTAGSSGGGSSSRKNSTASSIDRRLPVPSSSQGPLAYTSPPSMPQAAAAAPGSRALGSGSLDNSATGSFSGSSPAGRQLAGDTQQQQPPQPGKQGQGQAAAAAAPVQHQEVQVLPVLTTGSELADTSSSTPERALGLLVRHQQQQQQPGTDAEDGGECDDGAERVAEVWLVLELCTGGSLQDSFKQRDDAFEMARLLCRLAEVAQGMAYLHSKQVIHGDLKAANVLLVNSIHGSFGQVARLTDFGLAGVLRDGVTHRSTQNLGTVSHCPPEVLVNGRVSPAADVYAFGVMMWELLTSRTAYRGEHYGSIIQMVVEGGHRPTIPPDAPEDYALLMETCWATDPAARPTFEQVLECLAIMIQSLDSNSSSSTAGNNLLAAGRVSPRTLAEEVRGGAAAGADAARGAGGGEEDWGEDRMRATAAAGDAGAAAAAAAGAEQNGSSSKVGSFDICRTASSMGSGSAQQGIINSSSGAFTSAGLGILQSAASRGSSDLTDASAAAAAAAGAAAAFAPGTSPAGVGLGPQRSMGAWYARKSSLQPAGTAAGAGASSVAAGHAVVGSPSASSSGCGGMMAAGPMVVGAPSHFTPQQQWVVAGGPLAPLAETDAAAAADLQQGPNSSCTSSFSARGTPAAATAAAAAAGDAGFAGTGVQQQSGPAMLAARALGGAAGGDGVHKGGSAGSAGSGSSSALSQLQAPAQSRHIQDLW